MQQRILKYGNKLFPVQIGPMPADPKTQIPRLKIKFGWSSVPEWTGLKEEIKAMTGARFHSENGEKFWSITDNSRNRFNLDFLDKNKPNPYAKWKEPFPIYDFPRAHSGWSEINSYTMRGFQINCASEVIAKRQMLLSLEMGAGKTLIAISVLDMLMPKECWYVAPAFALHDIKRQFHPATIKNPGGWGCHVWPNFMSYEEMVKELKTWKAGRRAPDAVIFDESVQVKTPDSQRSQYALALAEGMRADWDQPLILCMSGAPAPKDPGDFWHQMEIIAPGYLREGNLFKFRNRLALIKKVDNARAGGWYPKLVTWWDDPNKCQICGEYEDADDHQDALGVHFHRFQPSVDEVGNLYKRMDGAVRVLFKKDILPELPEKVYRRIELKPDRATQRRLKLILKGSSTAIGGLILARELSDGIRYETIESEDQFEVCERCQGTCQMIEFDGTEKVYLPCERCDHGDGPTGQQRKEVKNTIYVPTPKDKALKELLLENQEQGRLVVFAGFTGSINRIVTLCQKEGWETIRVDGTTRNAQYGCIPSWPATRHPLEEFQDPNSEYNKIVFIGHPQRAKAGITLTRAYMIVYYSNTFNGDDRIQSEDRIHRLGMDLNKGAVIVDLLHLPTDLYVLQNLQKKRRLQSISLGELQREMLKEAV